MSTLRREVLPVRPEAHVMVAAMLLGLLIGTFASHVGPVIQSAIEEIE